MAARRWDRTALQGRRVYWLLDLTYAGTIHRLSTVDVDVTSDDGDLHYVGAISEATLTEGLDLLGESGEPMSVPIEALMPVDVAALSAAGHDLAIAVGELARWIEGTTWEDRKVVLVGRVADPEYGAADLPVRFSLEDLVFDDSAMVPESGASVSKMTTNAAYVSTSDLDVAYPIIIGHPGQVRAGTRTTGSIAPWRQKITYHHQVVLAGHRVQCGYVRANNDGTTTTQVFQVSHVTDRLGREIAVIVEANGVGAGVTPGTGTAYFPGLDSTAVPATFQPAVAEEVPLFIVWEDPDDLTLGGLIGEVGDLVRGAGDVIEYLLRQSSRRVDFGRIRAVKDRLNGFKLDFAIGERVSPWAFVRDNILPLLPVTVVAGPDGLYLVVFDYGATAADAVASIDEDANPSIELGQRITSDSGHVANHFTISYAHSARTSVYVEQLVMGAVDAESHATADLVCCGTEIIRIIATSPGGAGGGYTISVTSTGALTAAENTGAKTVALTFNSGVTTSQMMVTYINNNLTAVRAVIVAGTGAKVFDVGAIGSTATASEQTVTMSSTGGAVDLPSYFCSVSQGRHRNIVNPTGVVEKSIETRCIYDPATAAMVLSWQARALSLPWRRVDALLPEADFAWIERGNVVTITSARLSLSAKVAHVEAVETSDDGMVAVTLIMLQDPPMDNRT